MTSLSSKIYSRNAPGIGRTRRRVGERLLVHVVLVCVCAGFLLPFLWMLSTSLKTSEATMASPPQLLPAPPVVANYPRIFTSERVDFLLYARNTPVIAMLSVVGTLVSSSLAAYAFARIRFRGRAILFTLLLSTLMLPFPVTMVSLFALFRWIGDHTPLQMLGTNRPLWLPTFFGSAFHIFLLRQFFLTLPEELSEAARLDGCSEWGVFTRIVLPLSRPALTAVALFAFLAAWNDFLGPLVYLQRPEQYTLSLGLQAFQSQHGGTEWNLLMAAAVLTLLPVVLLFFLAQKAFLQGVATTGLKG